MKSEHQNNKRVSENIIHKIVQELIFPELTVKKAKLKRKTFHTRNSAQLINSEKWGTRLNDICVPKLFGLKQDLSFLSGIFILRPSVSTSVNRQKYLIFK